MKDYDIHTEEQLTDFLAQEMRQGSQNLPLWRLFLKEDYQPGKSLFVLKIHHSITDGYGITSLMLNLVDNSTFNGDSLKHLTTKPS